MTEREVLLTGIGGQGVQLAAQVLARAAALEGRSVMLFGVYSGVMRGGNTDATVVVADGPVQAPPIVSAAWSAIALHSRFWEPLATSIPDDELPGRYEAHAYCLAVADGMGGHRAGEVASRLALRTAVALILNAARWALKSLPV